MCPTGHGLQSALTILDSYFSILYRPAEVLVDKLSRVKGLDILSKLHLPEHIEVAYYTNRK